MLDPELTLDKAVTIATQVESAVLQAKAIASDGSVSVQAVQPHPRASKKKNKQYTRPNKPSSSTTISSRSCFRCGSDKHLANFSLCHAAKASCKSCHKLGHFAWVCRSSKTSGVGEIKLPKLTVLYLKDPCYAPKSLQCKINISRPAALVTEHELVVDSGSAMSILPQHNYDKYLSDILRRLWLRW